MVSPVKAYSAGVLSRGINKELAFSDIAIAFVNADPCCLYSLDALSLRTLRFRASYINWPRPTS